MDQVTASAGIIAVVEAIKRVFPQVTGVWTIVVAVVLGGVAGYLGLNGLNLASGIMAGLMASGVHQVASAAGSK